MPIDPRKYPANWKAISWRIRFVRAGNKCEWCGAVNHQSHPVTGSYVILTVAHLDHNTHNNSEDNLAALCQLCHNRHDAAHRAESRRAKSVRTVKDAQP